LTKHLKKYDVEYRPLDIVWFMIGAADGRYELQIGSSILTRRGRTDANTPKSTRKAILRDWHVGILDPQMLEDSGKMSQQ